MDLPTNRPTMTSLQIAEIAGKQHRHVLAAIRKMEGAWRNVCGSNFRLTFRDVAGPNGAVRQEPYYVLTKEECLYIATKFNDEARAKLVLRWMELEEKRAQRAPISLEDLFAKSRKAADEMREELRLGKALPARDVPLTNNDIAIYCYLRNGIKAAVSAPFCVTSEAISKAVGVDEECVERAWEALEAGGYIATRMVDGNRVFILGSRVP